jgi:hypothetical protein
VATRNFLFIWFCFCLYISRLPPPLILVSTNHNNFGLQYEPLVIINFHMIPWPCGSVVVLHPRGRGFETVTRLKLFFKLYVWIGLQYEALENPIFNCYHNRVVAWWTCTLEVVSSISLLLIIIYQLKFSKKGKLNTGACVQWTQVNCKLSDTGSVFK